MKSPEDQVYTELAGHGWKVGRGMANGQAVWTAYIFRVCLLELCCVWAPKGYNMQAAYKYTVAWWGLPGTLSHWCDCEEKLLKRPVHMGWVRGWLWPLMQRSMRCSHRRCRGATLVYVPGTTILQMCLKHGTSTNSFSSFSSTPFQNLIKCYISFLPRHFLNKSKFDT